MPVLFCFPFVFVLFFSFCINLMLGNLREHWKEIGAKRTEFLNLGIFLFGRLETQLPIFPSYVLHKKRGQYFEGSLFSACSPRPGLHCYHAHPNLIEVEFRKEEKWDVIDEHFESAFKWSAHATQLLFSLFFVSFEQRNKNERNLFIYLSYFFGLWGNRISAHSGTEPYS